jgi:hypothetical protein
MRQVSPNGMRLRPAPALSEGLDVDMHPGQLTVSADVVRGLVAEQFPRWRRLRVTDVVSTGTVNALFRIGDGLVARFPLQPASVEQTRRWLEAEARAAGELIGRTPFPTPRPVAIGEPGSGYPLVGSDVAGREPSRRGRPRRVGGLRGSRAGRRPACP